MKNKISIVITSVLVVTLVLWGLVQYGRVNNPMWTPNVNKAYKDAIETYGSAADVNISPGGNAIWDKSRLKGLNLVEVMDKTMKTCCPTPTDGVVRVQMKVDIRHPYIATAIMSVYPELTYSQGREIVEVRCASLGACLVILAYVIGMATMPFDQFLAKYQLAHTAPGSFASEVKANLQTVANAWNDDNMGTYNNLKVNLQKMIEQYANSLPESVKDNKCTADSCNQSVFDYPKFTQPPAPLRANEGFTTDRVFLEEGEYIENFMHRPKDNVAHKYVTRRHLDAPTPQLPAYSFTTLGGAKDYRCADGIVGCTIKNPMFRVTQTHEINSCAKPKTSYSIEPVSLRNPRDPFALGEKSYPLFDDATYHRLTHSMYSPNLPTRTAK